MTNGNIIIEQVNRDHLLAFLNVLTKMEAKFEIDGDEMRVWRKGEDLLGCDVTTAPYPGFMTDWQPLIALLLTQTAGTSLVYDTVYWDRFNYIVDLNRMGAKIKLTTPSEKGLELVISEDTYDLEKLGEPKTVAEISGPTPLKGAKLHIPDLRAGAMLIIAALAAEGKSEIVGFENVTRGYEDFVEKLSGLGANITKL
jgi:UDP-N-acetylglucosamine 1-carboxyvinyltransferase